MDVLNIKDVSIAQLDDKNNITVNLFDSEENQDHQNTPVFSQLGVACYPTSPTSAGSCQAMIAPGIMDGVVIGMHDSRTSNVYGNLKPGDTCIYSVDENQGSQILLKGEKKTIVLRAEDSKTNKDIFITIDGTNSKIQICGFKNMIELSENGITMATQGSSSAAIILNPNGQVIIKGTSVMIGESPNPLSGALFGSAAAPITSTSVFIST